MGIAGLQTEKVDSDEDKDQGYGSGLWFEQRLMMLHTELRLVGKRKFGFV